MKARELGRYRLMNLQVAASRCRSPVDVVSMLGAMQAQDYAGGLWAVGLRLPGSQLGDIEQAVADGSIVRTWPLRGTLHLVAAGDVYWLLDLLAARVIKASAKRQAQLELDAATFRKVEQLLTKQLAGGAQLTRDDIRVLLSRANVSPDGGRLYHCMWRLSLEQVLCFGAPVGKQPTFALLGERVPRPRRLARDEAISTLTTRYFASHGPATSQDLMRWAGLTSAEVKQGLASSPDLASAQVDGRRYYFSRTQGEPGAAVRGTFLLPGFDEYILGYADRAAILASEHASKIVPGGNGVFRPTIVHDGQVIGTWKASSSKSAVRLTSTAFEALSKTQASAFARAAGTYGAFVGKAARVA